jgi:hypothetical protein
LIENREIPGKFLSHTQKNELGEHHDVLFIIIHTNGDTIIPSVACFGTLLDSIIGILLLLHISLPIDINFV